MEGAPTSGDQLIERVEHFRAELEALCHLLKAAAIRNRPRFRDRGA